MSEAQDTEERPYLHCMMVELISIRYSRRFATITLCNAASARRAF
jgi:hypothetical protein